MPGQAEFAAGVLEAAHALAVPANEEGLWEVLRRLPRSVTGGGQIEFITGAEGTPPGVWSEPVMSQDVRVGELRQTGGDAGALPALARLVGARLDAIRQLEDLRRLNQGLQLDRVYFEELFAASPEAIVVLDGADRVVRVNRMFEKLFGYTLAEAQGRTINDLIVPDELRESAAALTRDVAAGRSVQVEAPRRRKDGTILYTSILGTPVIMQGDQVAVYGLYRDITAQKETEEALRRLSTTDELTGLFNRRGFFLLAEQQRRLAMRKQAELLLLYIDIDDFKQINDKYGHREGDAVLADIGAILRRCFRDSDIVARLGDDSGVLARVGGDEFVILAVDAGNEGDAILTTRLRERLDRYTAESEKPYTVTVSVGAIRGMPAPDVTVDSLIAAADKLMYQNKRDRFRI